jgi:secreted trypsin-like serine protease
MKVSIVQIKKGDIIKFSDGLGTHTAVALGRIEKSAYQNEYSLPICYTSTTQPKYTEVGKEGVKFFKNYKSTVNKIN